MDISKISQWRTVVIAVVGLIVLAVLAVLSLRASPSEAEHIYNTLTGGVEVLVLIGAGKSAVQHLATGKGAKGAIAQLKDGSNGSA